MLKEKMIAVISAVNEEVAERRELINMIAVCLLTRKNLFILGDTGAAKSYAINRFRRRILGAKHSLSGSSPNRATRNSFSAAWTWGALSPEMCPRRFWSRTACTSPCEKGWRLPGKA